MTCLFIADAGSVTASELVQRLQVSPASVSKAVAFLEDQGLIRQSAVKNARSARATASGLPWF
ncbi:MAG TPA: helix-turn-helix domain-containing protein [Streptosporangiaceae bacterium]|nr:helix-turn-helix domain-containing protein [Streptosporangiaceae bacterium]